MGSDVTISNTERLLTAKKTHSITMLHSQYVTTPHSLLICSNQSGKGGVGKYALRALNAHSSNQYISYRYSEQLFQRALISCQQMCILAACQRAYIKTNSARQTQQQCVILSLHKWFLQTTAQCCTKRPVRTEGKNVKT